MTMRFLIRTRYFISVPILGLAWPPRYSLSSSAVVCSACLIGTVLYITAVGLYQLFIQQIESPEWLKIDSAKKLESNLIGVTIVVLAVNFMGSVFAGGTENLLQYGAGIALPIAALGLFVGLRTRSAL